MRNFIKIIITNFIIIFFLFQFAEISCFVYGLKKAYLFCNNGISFAHYVKSNIPIYKEKYLSFDKAFKKLPFRETVGTNYKNKKPIVLFGCSFAYGAGLQYNQTLDYYLSNLTKRKIYNRAWCGWGVQDMLYQVRKPEFFKDIVEEEPEYVLYLYMCDHFERLYREVWYFDTQIFYKNKNGKLQEESFFKAGSIFYGYSAKALRNFLATKYFNNPNKKEEQKNFLSQHFIESKNEMSKHWKNTKYCILVYSFYSEVYETLRELEKYGFKVIFLDNLTNIDFLTEEYQIAKNDLHPNEKAWKLLAPLIAKETNL